MTALTLPAPATANQRFKEGFSPTLALSLVAATALHALLFELWPALDAPSWVGPEAAPTEVVRVETSTLPPPPKPLRAPARPVISPVATPDQPLETVSWAEVPKLPPPVQAPKESKAAADGTWLGPVSVWPSLANPDEMRRALERAYPSLLRDAGIGGTVGLRVRIDGEGRVLEARIARSSGHAGLDDAALKVSNVLRFHPAMNRDTPVSVWVDIPVTFVVHDRVEALEAGTANR